MAPIEAIDPKDLAQTGWGVVFAQDASPGMREALAPLLEHRRAQAAATAEHRYRELAGEQGVRPDDTKSDFLARQGAGPGLVDPDKVPYYLLLVGSPEAIPYRFQYHLDVQHAIGRIHFVDENGREDLEAYDTYARGVVAAETGLPLPRRATFIGVQNADDPLTALTTQELVEPLVSGVVADKPGWEVRTVFGTEGTKSEIGSILGQPDSVALLVAVGHGVGFPSGDPRQLGQQGALLCSDWPGPKVWRGPIPPEHYFAAHDVANDARLQGMIVFLHASFGAGTTHMDDYAHRAFAQPQPIAPHSFVAALPRRLLSHANGSALAFIGPVERSWTHSFAWRQTGRQLNVFASTLKRLMEGHPIGSAVEFFNERYAELATTLSTELEDIKFGKRPDDYALAEMWMAHNDARSYAIVGDPAVRLLV